MGWQYDALLIFGHELTEENMLAYLTAVVERGEDILLCDCHEDSDDEEESDEEEGEERPAKKQKTEEEKKVRTPEDVAKDLEYLKKRDDDELYGLMRDYVSSKCKWDVRVKRSHNEFTCQDDTYWLTLDADKFHNKDPKEFPAIYKEICKIIWDWDEDDIEPELSAQLNIS